jgi:hypothetical protein
MGPIKNEPPTEAAQAKNRNVAFIVGGMGILGIIALIVLLLFSSFPGYSAASQVLRKAA